MFLLTPTGFRLIDDVWSLIGFLTVLNSCYLLYYLNDIFDDINGILIKKVHYHFELLHGKSFTQRAQRKKTRRAQRDKWNII